MDAFSCRSTRVNLGATYLAFLCQMESAKRIVFYHLALQVPARVVRVLSYFP